MNPTWRFSSACMGLLTAYALTLGASLTWPGTFGYDLPMMPLVIGFVLGGFQHPIARGIKEVLVSCIGVVALWLTFAAEGLYSQTQSYLPHADPVLKSGFGSMSLVGLVVALLAAFYVFRKD